MLFSLYTITLVLSALFFSFAGCCLARYLLLLTQTMDEPNERSNHAQPVPRGGGIAIVTTLVGFLFVAGMPGTALLAMIGLAVISFLDDRAEVDFRLRLAVQLLAVILLFLPGGVIDLHTDTLIFQGWLPLWLDRLAAGLLLLGFVNLFNFMDGIDGITGAQSIALGVGFFLLSFCGPGIKLLGAEGLIVAATALGFLALNWHPARLFMGDVGSIPLGYLLGFMLLYLAGQGYGAAALILPAYYWVDGGLTLGKRLIDKEKLWEAHSKHAYQRAVRSGFAHDAVVKEIAVLNGGLIVLAGASILAPASALYLVILAYGATGVLWNHLRHARPTPQQTVLPPSSSSQPSGAAGDALSA